MQAAPTNEQVEAALARVYARPELQAREPGELEGVRGAVRRFFSRMGEGMGGDLRTESPVLYWLVVGGLVALAVGIIAYFLYTTLARLQDEAAGGGRAPRAGPGGPVDARARTAGEWEEEARRAAAAGRYRDASIALYQALLLRLEAAGALRYDPAKTPGDYRREARGNPRAAGALAAFLRGFEPAVFGGRALDEAGYGRLCSAAGEAGVRG